MDSGHLPIKRSRTKSAEKSAQLDRSLVQKWSKEELEDKFLNLYQEHNVQKGKLRELEEANRNHKVANAKLHDQVRRTQAQSGASAAEVRATDQVAKLELRLLELERQNTQLQGQAALRKAGQLQPSPQQQQQHHAGGGKSRGGYRSVGGAGSSARLSRSMSGSAGGGAVEAMQLRREVESLREQLAARDLELRAAVQEAHSERDVSQLQASGGRLTSMQDDLEKVRLQRLLREKSSVVDQMQIKCETLEERLRDLQSANAVLLQTSEQARLSARMQEQESSAALGSSAMGQATQKRVMQLEHALEDARAEAQVLRESNEKLISSAFDTDRERQWREREMALMAQIRQLEAGRQLGGHSVAAAATTAAKGPADPDLERELSTLRIRYYELQMKQEVLQERLQTMDYRKQGITDEEFRATLALVQKRHDSVELQAAAAAELAFLRPTTDVGGGSKGSSSGQQQHYQKRLLELEAAHADAMLELEKTRELLKAQQLLNNDTKAGHSLTEFRLNEVRAEYEAKIGELNKLLEIRAARIRQLEQQLAAQSYGGKSQGPPPPPSPTKLPLTKGSSPDGSVTEETCVEKIQGVAESAYRQCHAKARPASRQVVGAMEARIGAPSDRQLTIGGEADLVISDSTDNESVHSAVVEPVKAKPRESARVFTKEAIELALNSTLSKLTNGQSKDGHGPSLPPPPPYEEPGYAARVTQKIRTEEHKMQQQQQQQQQQQLEEKPAGSKETVPARDDDSGDDSDAVVVVGRRTSQQQESTPVDDNSVSTCYVQVLEVHLESTSEALANQELDETGCYVVFCLPGYNDEDVETPLSIRTPRPGVSRETEFTLRYNFQRTYDFDFDKNYSKRINLATLLIRERPTLPFTLVCEALDGSDFYLDFARAELLLADLIDGSERTVSRTLPLTSSETGEHVGTIKVGLDLPNLLRAIREEIPPGMKLKYH